LPSQGQPSAYAEHMGPSPRLNLPHMRVDPGSTLALGGRM